MKPKTPLSYLELIFSFGILISTPAFSAGFDCTKAASNVEKMICADANLSQLDSKMSDLYTALLKMPDFADSTKEMQKAWIKEQRNKCTTAQCLTQVYSEHVSNLENFLAQSKETDNQSPDNDKINSPESSHKENTILGTWLCLKDNYYTFNNDGTFQLSTPPIFLNEFLNNIETTITGNYQLTDNLLTLQFVHQSNRSSDPKQMAALSSANSAERDLRGQFVEETVTMMNGSMIMTVLRDYNSAKGNNKNVGAKIECHRRN